MHRTMYRRRIDSNRVFRWHDDQWLMKALGVARADNLFRIWQDSPRQNREMPPVSDALTTVGNTQEKLS